MKIIDYYDGIHKKWIKVKVNNKVAEYLQKSDKRKRRSDNFFRWQIAHSLDELVNKNCDGNLTFAQICEDKKSLTSHNFEMKEFAKMVNLAVDKLSDIEKKIVFAMYTIGHSGIKIAKQFNMKPGEFSRTKVKILSHLRKILINSIQFRKSQYYKKYCLD